MTRKEDNLPLHLFDPLFEKCLMMAANTPEMVAEYDRLSGTNLSRRGTPLDLMIDDAVGRQEKEMQGFIEFVRECIYERIPRANAEKEG